MSKIKEIFLYFDDSGVLHKNDKYGYFIYAGYVFIDKESKENAKRRYRKLNIEIKKSLDVVCELKACNLEIKHKASLFKVMREQESVAAVVDIGRVYDSILSEKKSIHRYKDYVLKRAIKAKLKELISFGKIDPHDNIKINIFVDEQATATNGYYDLRSSIYEELKTGISNYNYNTEFSPIFFNEVIVNVEFCDSKSNFLIQASDILANRIWSSHAKGYINLRNIPSLTYLKFP